MEPGRNTIGATPSRLALRVAAAGTTANDSATLVAKAQGKWEPWIEFEGDPTLLDALSDVLRRALATRPAFYHVRVEGVGRCGEVMICISGIVGRLPLLFGRDELEPGYVLSVIRENLERFSV